eukprot:UN24110
MNQKYRKLSFLKKRISKYEEKIITLESREIISSHEALTKNLNNRQLITDEIDMIDTLTSVKSEDMDVEEMRTYIESQKSLIGQMRFEINKLQETLRIREELIKSNQNSNSQQIDEKHAMAIDELQNVLTTAKLQITNMRDQLLKKDTLIAQFKAMIEKLNEKYKYKELDLYNEINKLNEYIRNDEDHDMRQLNQAIGIVTEGPKIPTGCVTQEEFQDVVKDNRSKISTLIEENEFLTNMVDDLKLNIGEKEIDVKELTQQFEEARKGSKKTEDLLKQIRKDCKIKENKQKKLTATIIELRDQIIEVKQKQVDSEFDKKREESKIKNHDRNQELQIIEQSHQNEIIHLQKQ